MVRMVFRQPHQVVLAHLDQVGKPCELRRIHRFGQAIPAHIEAKRARAGRRSRDEHPSIATAQVEKYVAGAHLCNGQRFPHNALWRMHERAHGGCLHKATP